MRLSDLKQGQTGIIRQVGGSGQLRQHFLDMGLIQGTEITYMKAAPMGDPIEYRIWGYELTLRKDDGAKIEIELVEKREGKKKQENINLLILLTILILVNQEFTT